MNDAPASVTPVTATHPAGGPAAEPYQQHVPVSFRFTKMSLGSEPETVTEHRHLIYTHFSYRKLAEALGVDLREMSKQTRRMRQRYAELTRKHGKKKADGLFAEEFSAASRPGGPFGDAGDVQLDDMEQVAAMVWGGLITEDPTITQEDVMRRMTAQNQTDILLAAVKSINIYLHGESAASMDYEKVRADIAAGLAKEATPQAVSDALGVETDEDAAEAAAVRTAKAGGLQGDAEEIPDLIVREDEGDGAEGNGAAA